MLQEAPPCPALIADRTLDERVAHREGSIQQRFGPRRVRAVLGGVERHVLDPAEPQQRPSLSQNPGGRRCGTPELRIGCRHRFRRPFGGPRPGRGHLLPGGQRRRMGRCGEPHAQHNSTATARPRGPPGRCRPRVHLAMPSDGTSSGRCVQPLASSEREAAGSVLALADCDNLVDGEVSVLEGQRAGCEVEQPRACSRWGHELLRVLP